MFSSLESFNLRRHDEITLGEAIDLMRPKLHFDFSPCQQNVRMMTLFLRQRSDAIDQLQRLREIRKLYIAASNDARRLRSHLGTSLRKSSSSFPLTGGTPPRHGTHVLSAKFGS